MLQEAGASCITVKCPKETIAGPCSYKVREDPMGAFVEVITVLPTSNESWCAVDQPHKACMLQKEIVQAYIKHVLFACTLRHESLTFVQYFSHFQGS